MQICFLMFQNIKRDYKGGGFGGRDTLTWSDSSSNPDSVIQRTATHLSSHLNLNTPSCLHLLGFWLDSAQSGRASNRSDSTPWRFGGFFCVYFYSLLKYFEVEKVFKKTKKEQVGKWLRGKGEDPSSDLVWLICRCCVLFLASRSSALEFIQ